MRFDKIALALKVEPRKVQYTLADIKRTRGLIEPRGAGVWQYTGRSIEAEETEAEA